MSAAVLDAVPASADERRVDTADVLGIPCLGATVRDATSLIVERALARSGGYGCFANTHVLALARRAPDLGAALRGAWLVFPDGAPVASAVRASIPCAERLAGPDLMGTVLAAGVDARLRHYFLGSDEATLARLTTAVSSRLPEVRIVGAHSPSFAAPGELAEAIRADAPDAKQADVVWCAFGAPKQELLMARLTPAFERSLLLGVGAAFAFLAGTQGRAPLWMQRAGLEWAHRLAQEPTRLGSRYLRWNTEYLLRRLHSRLRPERAAR